MPPLLSGESPIAIAPVAELLRRLYPGEAWLERVLAVENDPGLLELFG